MVENVPMNFISYQKLVKMVKDVYCSMDLSYELGTFVILPNLTTPLNATTPSKISGENPEMDRAEATDEMDKLSFTKMR